MKPLLFSIATCVALVSSVKAMDAGEQALTVLYWIKASNLPCDIGADWNVLETKINKVIALNGFSQNRVNSIQSSAHTGVFNAVAGDKTTWCNDVHDVWATIPH